MADSVNCEIKGVDSVKKAFEVMTENVDMSAKQATWKVAGRITTQAKRAATRQPSGVFTGTPSHDPEPGTPTGRLGGSLTMASSEGHTTPVNSPAKSADAVNRPSAPMGEFIVAVGTNVEYAADVEFGTRKMAPRRYLYPAYFKNATTLNDEIKRQIENRQACEYFLYVNKTFNTEIQD